MLFVTYNIHYGVGRDGRLDLGRIASEVADADVIALQEVERGWARTSGVDQVAEIVTRLDAHYWAYGPGIDLYAHAPPDAPDRRARRRQFGNMLLARTPLLSVRNHLLPKHGSLGPTSIQRAALEGLIETACGTVRVYSVHLDHLCAETRLPQIEHLLAIHSRAPREGAAIGGDPGPGWARDGAVPGSPRDALLLGDFNFEPESREYARVCGPLSPYGGRVVEPEGFIDAWVEAGNPPGAGASGDVNGRPARLDYCFVSAPLRARIRDARVRIGARGSDHQPLWVEMEL